MKIRRVEDYKIFWFSQEENYTTGADALRVKIKCRLRTIRGEIFTNTKIGLPHLSKILIKENYDLYVRSELSKIAEIEEVLSFDSWITDHKYHAIINVKYLNEKVEVEI